MGRLIERLIDWTEKAAGIFLAAITILIFSSITLRGTFGFTIPEWYDLSRLMLGVCIFWGIAATSYRNDHIKVDILWEWLGPRGRRWLDVVATLVLLGFLAVFSYMLYHKVGSGYRSGEQTFDLRIRIWPFHLVAACGIFFATLLVLIRLFRLLAGRADDDRKPIQPIE